MEFLETIPLVPRVVLLTAASYLYLIVVIRLTGKRSVAHMNSFDWLVNVAVGALTASAILTPGNTVAAWLAIGTIAVLQVSLTRAAMRFGVVGRLVREEPRLLMRDGRFLRDTMREQAISRDEMMQAIRSAGLCGPEDVAAIVFEADGRLSVIAGSEHAASPKGMSALEEFAADDRTATRADAAA